MRSWLFFLDLRRGRRRRVRRSRALVGNDYVFFAGYVVLQFIVLATAWNILGGYTGYVNFGSAAFFALGAYTTVFFHKTYPLPLPVLIADRRHRLRRRRARHGLSDAAAARRVLRHRDAGARGRAADAGRQLDLCRRRARRLCDPAGQRAADRQLRAVPVPADARRSRCSRSRSRARSSARGSATASPPSATTSSRPKPRGVPTLRLKLIATTISGALMGMAGAPFPYYIGYVQPTLGLRARLRGQLDRDADDRRHHQLGRPADRRDPARHAAAGRDRDASRRRSTC